MGKIDLPEKSKLYKAINKELGLSHSNEELEEILEGFEESTTSGFYEGNIGDVKIEINYTPAEPGEDLSHRFRNQPLGPVRGYTPEQLKSWGASPSYWHVHIKEK